MDEELKSHFADCCRKRGKLAPVENDIFDLLLAGASYGEITSVLLRRNIKADRAEIYRYVNRKVRKQRLTAVKDTPLIRKENVARGVEPMCPASDLDSRSSAAHSVVATSAPSTADPALPKFNWNEIRKNCKLNW